MDNKTARDDSNRHPKQQDVAEAEAEAEAAAHSSPPSPPPTTTIQNSLFLPIRISPSAPFFSFRLPIPSPALYWDNYHHPLFPHVLPPINCFADPAHQPLRFPSPMGPLSAHHFNILGASLHDFGYVNFNPDKLFVKYMLWYLELNDHLFRVVCPSDLTDVPCEWDELQGGCPMLRLCEVRHKYPHPHLGVIPPCQPDLRFQCRYLHDVQPTCRGLVRSLRRRDHRHYRSLDERLNNSASNVQQCDAVAAGRFCDFGHDFESARIEAAVEGYWKHRAEARARGSTGFVKRDVWGRKMLRPVCSVEFLEEEPDM